jgi:hypothetical protein
VAVKKSEKGSKLDGYEVSCSIGTVLNPKKPHDIIVSRVKRRKVMNNIKGAHATWLEIYGRRKLF